MAKKREMFLVQMSLDVKKAEILKLDARAKDKEEAERRARAATMPASAQCLCVVPACKALNKSKQMLDKDVERFDTFLSWHLRRLKAQVLGSTTHAAPSGTNDSKAHAAMKNADETAKQKQERALWQRFILWLLRRRADSRRMVVTSTPQHSTSLGPGLRLAALRVQLVRWAESSH